MPDRTMDQLLDAVGLPTSRHQDTASALELFRRRCGVPAPRSVAHFLGRSIHTKWIPHRNFGELGLVGLSDMNEFGDDHFRDASMAGSLLFGVDGGGRFTYFDPSLGLGDTAVFVVSPGAPFATDADVLTLDLETFVQALVDGRELSERPVAEARAERSSVDS